MKFRIPVSAALLLLGSGLSCLFAQKPDFHQPQTPSKPAPAWLKIIDQGQYDPRLKGYFTPEGIKVEIVAEFPTVTNPVGMTFADDGTPHVLEWRPDPGGNSFPEHPEALTYKDGSTCQVVTMKKRVKDVVKVLHDTHGRGVYDQAEIILEEELPSSILLHDGWLYLTGRGTVRRYRQSRDGGPYDIKEVIAQGFCGFHHHQVSGLTLGNDGWLYLTSGDDDNYVEGSDGSRATVLRTGAVFRCRPDGSRMQVYSCGYRNPYRDVAFDAAFNCFHADNDNEDGSKFTGCRLMHVAEGSDYGWRLRSGAHCCVPDSVRGAVFGELPGKVPPLAKTGRGAPAGLLIYNDSRFPEQFRGLLYYPDVFRKLIRAYKVQPDGASFAITEEFEFLKSADPLFRPCQMVLGPDGAMYIVDWRTDSGGAGQLWGDGKHGRIYRLRWAGTPEHPALPLRDRDSWAHIARMSEGDLLRTLDSPEFSDRQRAQRELVHRGPRIRPTLLKRGVSNIAELGVLEAFWNDDVRAAVYALLNDKEPDLRRLAADALGLNCRPRDAKAHAALLEALGDPNPAVRRAVALAMGRIGAPGAADSLANALRFDDGTDVFLRDGLVRALERLGTAGIEKLLALADSGVAQDRDKAVEAFEALRERPGAEAIPRLLQNPHLSAAQRAGLLRSYTNYVLDPPVSVQPVLDYLLAHPQEEAVVKLAGLEALSVAGPLHGDKAEKLLLALLDESDSRLRLSAIRGVESARLNRAAPRLAHLLGEAGLSVEERTAVAKALRGLNDKVAVGPLQRIIAARAEAGAVRVEALRTLAALDVTTAQALARELLDQDEAELRREAVLVLGSRPEGARLVGERFLAKKLPRELLPQVSEALRNHAAKEPALAKLLTDVMKGGLLLSLDEAEVARVRKLVLTRGKPERGRALYLNSKTLACITCHRMEGVGGNVGPDLTRLWDTQSVEKILESLLDPSKEIKEGYQTYVATTKKGQVYTGLKVSQTAAEVVLADANAKDVIIPTKDLEELTVSKQSLMPENVVAQLTFEQFLDLVAFLKDRAAQEALQGMPREFWVVGPFGEDLEAAYPPEKNPDPTATYPGEKSGEKRTWEKRTVEPDGLLNLRAVFDRDHISAYALTYVYSPQEQKVRMLVGSDDTVRIWLNGRLVHEYATPRSARPDEDRVPVTLQAGWNRVLAKVVNGEVDHGLYLRFAGGQGLRLSLKPE